MRYSADGKRIDRSDEAADRRDIAAQLLLGNGNWFARCGLVRIMGEQYGQQEFAAWAIRWADLWERIGDDHGDGMSVSTVRASCGRFETLIRYDGEEVDMVICFDRSEAQSNHNAAVAEFIG